MKMPTIQNIFSKDKAGNYTNDALLYQDILKYSVREIESTQQYVFRIWELTEWLIMHNTEMVNYYRNSAESHMTTSNKINARLKRVRHHVDVLIYLGILGKYDRVKESKGEGMTNRYSITKIGYIVSLLIMSLYPKKRQKAINSFYNHSLHLFRDNPSSIDEFTILLFNKMDKNNFLPIYIDKLRESYERGITLGDKNNFFNNSQMGTFSDENSIKYHTLSDEDLIKYQKLREEAFEELEPDIRQYLKHKQKLEIERKMYGISQNLRAFERASFGLRNDYEKIVCEGYCPNCNVYFTCSYELDKYLKMANFYEHVLVQCRNCKDKAMTIPLFKV